MQRESVNGARREPTPPLSPLTLPLLSTADLYVPPLPTLFLQTVSDHLGNLGTSSDGFDTALAEPWNAVDGDADSVTTLLTHLQDADFKEGDFNAGYTDPIALDVQTFNTSGDNIVTDLGITIVPPDAPPPPVSPPIGTPIDPGGGGDGSSPVFLGGGGGFGWDFDDGWLEMIMY